MIASGSAQGPPAGPKSHPFTQCPAIGQDASCEYLIDVTSSDPSVLPTVVKDPTQPNYDGEDDVTVGIQNDTTAPLEYIRVGVPESRDHLFQFDGDGLCWSALSPKPSECPFGSSSYDGPDTNLSAESPDAGTVFFPSPLQPGQYTYFALEAEPKEGIVAGEVNDVVSTTLTNTETLQSGATLSAPAPAPVSDQAKIAGANAAKAGGTVEYLLYSDASCHNLVEALGKKNVENGVAQPSVPSNVSRTPTNATYYWVARYSGDTKAHDSANSSSCGSETMTFGTAPTLPQPSITTVLSGEGQHGTHITVREGAAVTDTAIITPPNGESVSGRVTYAAYPSASCTGAAVSGLGGGATSGIGPSTNPVALEAGKYYFRAFYSGNSQLRSAVTKCGDEVLTVMAPPSPAPPAPEVAPPHGSGGHFSLVGQPRVNETSGRIQVTMQLPGAGLVTATALVKQGATLARIAGPSADSADSRKCKRGFVSKHGRCVSNAAALFGAASLAATSPGTYTITIAPAQRVLHALRSGRRLFVTVSVTFQSRYSGAAVTHVRSVLVKVKRSHRKKR